MGHADNLSLKLKKMNSERNNFNYMEIGKSTHLGNIRKINEDALLAKQIGDGFLLIVADGMGGHNAGEVASEMAIKYIERQIVKNISDIDLNTLRMSLIIANKKIFESADRHIKHRGMGTTATVAYVFNNKAIIANVGDSRAYLLSKNDLKQITIDHSYVQMLIDKKILTKEEAKFHPRRNLITRALGTTDDVEVDIFICDFNYGDVIMLCSDGLISHVTDDFIKETLNKNISANQQVNLLIEEALTQGGSDNITIIIAKQLEKEGDF